MPKGVEHPKGVAHKIGESFRSAAGAVFESVRPLHRWRRKDGLASFLTNMLELRKTISLCHSCERKMPSKWLSRYNYALVYGFSTDSTGCDYCRQVGSTNLYHAVEGPYAQEMERSRIYAQETMKRDRKMFDKDPRWFMPF